MCEVSIRCEGGEFLTTTLVGRSHPGASDYWDGNWVMATVEVRAGGFSGTVGGHLRADELAAFHVQLARLQEDLHGTAEFTTMEDWLSIQAEGVGRGHVTFRCVVRDRGGDALHCTLETDQTFTRATVSELAAAVRTFPVVGERRR